jgi:hypothetical protein
LIDSAARARRNLRTSLPSVNGFIDALSRLGLADFAAILRQKPTFIA